MLGISTSRGEADEVLGRFSEDGGGRRLVEERDLESAASSLSSTVSVELPSSGVSGRGVGILRFFLVVEG